MFSVHKLCEYIIQFPSHCGIYAYRPIIQSQWMTFPISGDYSHYTPAIEIRLGASPLSTWKRTRLAQFLLATTRVKQPTSILWPFTTFSADYPANRNKSDNRLVHIAWAVSFRGRVGFCGDMVLFIVRFNVSRQ